MKILNDDEKLTALSRLAFDKLDATHRGYLAKGDIRSLFEEIAEELDTHISDSELDEIFIEIDENSDSRISFEEFKKFLRDIISCLSQKSGSLF